MSNEADDMRNAAKQISRDIRRVTKQARRELRRSTKQATKEGRWQTELEQGLKQGQAMQSELTKAARTVRAELKTAHQRGNQQQAPKIEVMQNSKQATASTVQAELLLHTVPLSLAALPPMTTQARQGLGVYALNELAKFERALLGLGINARAEQVSLVWHADLENSNAIDGRGRVGLKAQPVADIGGRLFTLQHLHTENTAQTPHVSTARLASEAEATTLAGGEWVAITPDMWGQVELWQGFSGGLLQALEGMESGESSLSLVWVAALVLAFVVKWWVGLLWLFGTGWLFSVKPVRPYRAAYFEDAAPPPALREWLWHILGRDNLTSDSLLPHALHLNRPHMPAERLQTTPQLVPQATHKNDLLERLPDDLAAGLRMVRERVADLPKEDIVTPEGYHLRQLDSRCEEAAALYLQLPEGSPAKAEAEAEVRAMLEDVLEDLAGAGSRSQQQQEQTLRAIRDLRARSSRSAARDPLKLD